MAAKAKKVDFETYKAVVELGMSGVATDVVFGRPSFDAIHYWLLNSPDKRPYRGYDGYWILVDADEET